jgi:CubicO group peptidase (beta-lactamase class C family)
VAERSGIAFQDYLDEALARPLGLTTFTSTDPQVPEHEAPSTISSD